VSLYASERVPPPHEAVAVVSTDIPSRTLTVSLSDLANGYTKLLWRESWRALRSAEEAGLRSDHPTVYASTDDAYQVAHAVTSIPDFGGQLRFTFADGDAYVRLISKPVTASVWIDKSRNRFINVNLKHVR
jgi:hypothetical protein